MSIFDDLFAANKRYASGFDKGSLPAPPARKLAIVTCMDARLLPNVFLGLEQGDAHVIRNAGGRVSDDAIRSLAASQTLLDTEQIAVIQHTRCGMQAVSDEAVTLVIKERTGIDTSNIELLTFSDVEESVRADVDLLAHSPLIAEGTPILGAVYDVETGLLTEVVRTKSHT